MAQLTNAVEPERAAKLFFGGDDETLWAQVREAIDDDGINLIDVIAGTGGPGGGNVDSVNDIEPTLGNVELSAADIPFQPTGSISAATVQLAIAEVAAEAGVGGGGDLSALADNAVVMKVWDLGEGEYVWPSGNAPSDGFTQIMFVGPEDPAAATGGRSNNYDLWIDTSV